MNDPAGSGRHLRKYDKTILDRQALQELHEDLGDDFQAFVQTFLGTAREGLTVMGTALHGNDIVQVGRQAHALQGTVGYLGAMRLYAQLQALQELADAGSPDPMAEILAAATTDFIELEKQLEEISNLTAL